MDRRTFLAHASGAAAWPALSRAQGARKLPRIGMATFPALSSLTSYTAAFEKGLREEGLVPGRDVVLDFRSANLDSARYGEVVRELVRSKPDVIVTGINTNTAAVKAETGTIPIVMTLGVDSVAMGFVESLARPGGNITGLTYDVGPESTSKRFELFKRAVPSIKRVGVLSDGDTEGKSRYVDWVESAARSAGLEVLRRDLGDDFEESFLSAKRWRADAVLFYSGARQFARRAELVTTTLRHRLPSNFPQAEFVELGGLMSFGPNIADLYRRGAGYVSRILKGAKPESLPVQQPIRLDLAINLKTARALGLTIPREILVGADRVIE